MRTSRAGIWISSDRGRAAPAFTFIELIVVLVILGISAAVVFPKVNGLLLREPEPWRSGRHLMRLAKRAQELAIATESAFLLRIDPRTGQYWVVSRQIDSATGGQDLSGQLPEEVAITDVETPAEDRSLEGVLAIEFSPEGWCDPVVVSLTSLDGRTVKLAVNEGFDDMGLIGDKPAE